MMIECHIEHSFEAFSLDVKATSQGPVTALWGKSGAGKTSVARAIAGLMRPKQGRIIVQERVLQDTNKGIFVPPHLRQVGYIFQDVRLFPHLDVEGNLRFGFDRAKTSDQEFERVVDLLGLGGLLKRRAFMLSGGEKQRVGIGRALLCAPKLLIADEPLSALDGPRRREIMPYFQMIIQEFDIPMIYVSHSLMELGWLAQEVWTLDHGKVVAQGPIDQVLHEEIGQSLAHADGHSTLLLTYQGQEQDGLWKVGRNAASLFLTQAPQSSIGSICPVTIKASDVILALRPIEGLSALNQLTATIAGIEPLSDHHVCVLLTSQIGTFQAHITRRSLEGMAINTGQSITAIIKTLALAGEF